MKIEDKIYIPLVCPDCSTARLIPRDDLHDHPEIICTECGGVMRRWVVYKEAPQQRFTDETFDLLTYTQGRKEITGSPWFAVSGSMPTARRKIKQDLVDDPGLPDMIFLPPEVRAAELRAEMMKEKIEDIVVTMVCNVTYHGTTANPGGTLHIESLRHSQIVGRIHELRELCDGTVKVLIIYSEGTHQLFGWNGLEIDEPPRLPKYRQEYEHKHKGYRTTTDGVIRDGRR
jgi:hypothetical protein